MPDDPMRKEFEGYVKSYFEAPDSEKESWLEVFTTDLVFVEFLLEKWKP